MRARIVSKPAIAESATPSTELISAKPSSEQYRGIVCNWLSFIVSFSWILLDTPWLFSSPCWCQSSFPGRLTKYHAGGNLGQVSSLPPACSQKTCYSGKCLDLELGELLWALAMYFGCRSSGPPRWTLWESNHAAMTYHPRRHVYAITQFRRAVCHSSGHQEKTELFASLAAVHSQRRKTRD